MDGGLSNIAIGANAGSHLHSGDYNIYLGHEGEARDESHTMRLGQHQTRTFIAGVTAPVRGTAVLITANGRLGIQVSAARYKTDIQPLGRRSQGLWQLRPVTFRYTQDPPGERQYGLIAEKVAAVYPCRSPGGKAGQGKDVQGLLPEGPRRTTVVGFFLPSAGAYGWGKNLSGRGYQQAPAHGLAGAAQCRVWLGVGVAARVAGKHGIISGIGISLWTR
jgi:hypothetical protein